MSNAPWVLYGAYGYTGVLVAEEAVRRGHRPILAGRSRSKLAPLAERLGLPMQVVDLDDRAGLSRVITGAPLVFHAAGPFVRTSAAMIDACLAAGASYVDVTGEIPVFQATLSRDEEARSRGVCLLSGVGFDVIPTDCLARYVADRVPGAVDLRIAIATDGKPSAGTTKSAIELLPSGNSVRREGRMVEVPLGHDARTVRFSEGERSVVAIPWGDLVTAYKTTGIANITTYMAMPASQARALKRFGGLIQRAMSLGPVRRAAQDLVERMVVGPDEQARDEGRCLVWASATDEAGKTVEAWLETAEGYRFTAMGGVRAVEKILADKPVGATTPALAFGADFVLEIPGSKRMDEVH